LSALHAACGIISLWRVNAAAARSPASVAYRGSAPAVALSCGSACLSALSKDAPTAYAPIRSNSPVPFGLLPGIPQLVWLTTRTGAHRGLAMSLRSSLRARRDPHGPRCMRFKLQGERVASSHDSALVAEPLNDFLVGRDAQPDMAHGGARVAAAAYEADRALDQSAMQNGDEGTAVIRRGLRGQYGGRNCHFAPNSYWPRRSFQLRPGFSSRRRRTKLLGGRATQDRPVSQSWAKRPACVSSRAAAVVLGGAPGHVAADFG